ASQLDHHGARAPGEAAEQLERIAQQLAARRQVETVGYAQAEPQERQREPRDAADGEPLRRDEEMSAQGHEERRGVEEDHAAGGGGKGEPAVDEDELAREHQAEQKPIAAGAV